MENTDFLNGLFLGLSSAVIAIVVQAVVRVSRRALTHPSLVVLALAAFLALTFFAVPFPMVVFGRCRWLGLGTHLARDGRAEADESRRLAVAPLISDDHLHAERPSLKRGGLILGIGLTLWAIPIVAAAVVFGRDSIFVDQGLFFSGAAVVTFGGAYAGRSPTSRNKPSTSTAGWPLGRWSAV